GTGSAGNVAGVGDVVGGATGRCGTTSGFALASGGADAEDDADASVEAEADTAGATDADADGDAAASEGAPNDDEDDDEDDGDADAGDAANAETASDPDASAVDVDDGAGEAPVDARYAKYTPPAAIAIAPSTIGELHLRGLVTSSSSVGSAACRSARG